MERRGFLQFSDVLPHVLVPLQGCEEGRYGRISAWKSPSNCRATTQMRAGDSEQEKAAMAASCRGGTGRTLRAPCCWEAVGSQAQCPVPHPHSLLTGNWYR